MILKIAKGESNLEVATALDVRPATVSKWRQRFDREGLEGLHDDFRPGRPAEEDAQQLCGRILNKLDEAPPDGYAKWNGRLLAEALEVSADAPDASPRILSLRARAPTLSDSTLVLRRTQWLYPSMRSPAFRLWSGRNVGSKCRTVVP
jgi:hypothetical protein